ncbi:MAG: N-acetylmuramoyl-L-alanine amidase CwlD [Bacillota bacterium]|nr:N-acetylmuramoyl-L-alanine amidase CwlD [Bacillota bacterium]
MILIIKKSNIILVILIFLLSIALYSLNAGTESAAGAVGGGSTAKTVIIDAGHGGEDPGAVSSYSGIKEKDINLNIAGKLRDTLKEAGYNVIMTRDEDKLVYDPETRNITQKRYEDLTRRKKIMDESGADITVSIHMNKFSQTQYWGAQVFYPPNSPESLKLAGTIQKSIAENVNAENKRQPEMKKDPIIILKNLKTTTVIVECGFLSNPEEEKLIATDDYQTKISNAIKIGIDKYFGK